MISDEVYDGIIAAIKVMKKLDAGVAIQPGSKDHENLTWAILKLYSDNLIDHSPLTGKNLEWAQRIAREYSASLKNDKA